MWLLWLIVALLATLAEVLSLNLVLLMFAGGALAAAGADVLGASLPVEVFVFALVSTLLLLVVRPSLLRFRQVPGEVTGVAALVGRSAEVVTEVDPRDGRVKLAGEVWSARAAGPGTVIPVGTRVSVIRIDGATVVVAPEPPAVGGQVG